MVGIAIGAIFGLEAIFAGPVCGASMNPAWSIAPAFVRTAQMRRGYLTAPVGGAPYLYLASTRDAPRRKE